MKIFNCVLGLALVATAAARPVGTYNAKHVSGTVTISDDGATFDGSIIVGKGLVPVDITCNAEQFTVCAKGKINLRWRPQSRCRSGRQPATTRMKVTPPLAVAPITQEDDMRWNPNDDGIVVNIYIYEFT